MSRTAKPTLTLPPDALVAPPPILTRRDNPGGGGTIAITTVTSRSRVAPESVRFGIDFSAATFDTPGPARGEIYDARMHELIYLWDFGDPGEWTAPVNVLAPWKNRSIAKGPVVTHLFRNPGLHTVSVLVIEPASGKTATAQAPVRVGDPDAYYAGDRTICVNPAGDGDFTGAPPGAVLITADALTKATRAWIAHQRGPAKRWLFKRGGVFRINLPLDENDSTGITFGAYGRGPNPIWLSPATGSPVSGSPVYFNRRHGADIHPQPPELRVFGIDFQGNFDPTRIRTDAPDPGTSVNGLAITSDVILAAYDCTFAGFKSSTIALNPVDEPGSPLTARLHFDNCVFTELGGQYPIALFNAYARDTCFSFTGCRITQNPTSPNPGANGLGGTRSLIRVSQPAHFHMRGCDLFQTDGTHHPLKMINTPYGDGTVINIHSTSIEGGDGAIMFGGNAVAMRHIPPRHVVHNAIIDGLVYVGAFNTRDVISMTTTGLTVRNCLAIIPPPAKWSNSFQCFLHVWRWKNFGPFDARVVGAAPIRAYNNTLRIDRTRPENSNGDFSPVFLQNDVPGDLTAVRAENNLVHMPNLDSASPDDPVATWAPVSDTVLWKPRTIGRMSADDFIMDTRYALPADAVKESRPLPGSAALGAALTGDVSYVDILLRERPEPPSIGAWEAD